MATTLSAPYDPSNEAKPVEVKTTLGPLRGKAEGSVSRFLGVPYAQPPLGRLRFKAPQPLAPWSGTRDAFDFGNPSLQEPHPEMGLEGTGRMPSSSEDCLYLNVWTPATDNKRRPVMFYSHGGGFMIGSGASSWQDGSNLAKRQDVVVVQSNHRLGVLGYLFLADIAGSDEFAANQGMQDILAALRWTFENIEAFGGDPDRIMIYGESGGGSKTTALYTMPAAAPYFRNASIESSARMRFPSRDGATERARITLHNLGVGEHELDKLYEVSPEQIMKAQLADMSRGEAPWCVPAERARPGLGVFVDGEIVPGDPFADGAPEISANKPLMTGTTADESVFFRLFGPKDVFRLSWADLPGELEKNMPPALVTKAIAAFRKIRPEATPSQLYFAITTSTIQHGNFRLAAIKAAQKAAPVYQYELSYHSPVKAPDTDFEIGAPHAADILMKFDNPEVAQDFIFGEDQSPARYQTAHNMSALWAGFARDGKPNAEGLPDWPAYTLETRATMRIDAECRVVNDLNREERLFWDAHEKER